MRWMEEAKAQLGETEIAGPKHNPEIVGYFADSKNAGIQNDEVAWCAAFVGAVLERSGIRSTRSLMARSYQDFGQPVPLNAPRYGAIAVFSRTSDPRFGHVGFVTGWTREHLEILGGNQSNAVNISRYPRSRLVALRWPEPAKTPREVEQAGSRIAKRAKKQQVDAGVAAGAGATAAAAGAAVQDHAPSPAMPDLSGLQETAKELGALQHSVDTLIDFFVFLAAKWPWVGGAVALYFGGRVIYDAVLVRLFRAEDESTGAHIGRQVALPAGTDSAEFTEAER